MHSGHLQRLQVRTEKRARWRRGPGGAGRWLVPKQKLGDANKRIERERAKTPLASTMTEPVDARPSASVRSSTFSPACLTSDAT